MEITESWFELYAEPGETEREIECALVPELHSLEVTDVILESGRCPAGELALACAGQKRCVFISNPPPRACTVLAQETQWGSSQT